MTSVYYISSPNIAPPYWIAATHLDPSQLEVCQADQPEGCPEERLTRLKKVGEAAPDEAGRPPVPHLVQLALSDNRGLCFSTSCSFCAELGKRQRQHDNATKR